MKNNNKPLIVLTIIIIIIFSINIMSAQNTCNYYIGNSSFDCIIKNAFGLTDIFYFIGKNIYIIIYIIILSSILKRRKKKLKYDKILNNSEVTESITTKQNKILQNKKYTNINYSISDIGLFVFIICMMIVIILLAFWLEK